MTPELVAHQMGLDLPDFDRDGYYGAEYGTMKPYHLVGNLLFLSGHVAQVGTEITHKGRLGDTLTTAQGYAAARQTGVNVLGGIRQALGSLDRVKGIVRTLNFVVCTAGYEDVHLVWRIQGPSGAVLVKAASSWVMASAGVFHPGVLRGRSFRSFAMWLRSR